jgi:hypothetical protein
LARTLFVLTETGFAQGASSGSNCHNKYAQNITNSQMSGMRHLKPRAGPDSIRNPAGY